MRTLRIVLLPAVLLSMPGVAAARPDGVPLPPPELLDPVDTATGVPINTFFEWSGVPGADSYWLTVADSPGALPFDPGSTSCPGCVISCNTASTTHTSGGSCTSGLSQVLGSDTNYYWLVRGREPDGTLGAPSCISNFGTGAEIRIDVMALYTPQARDAAGGVAAIETTIQAAVDAANTALHDSDMRARFFLVHTELADHADAGSLHVDLSWLKDDPGVGTLRDAYGADMVGLIVEDGGGICGVAEGMRDPGPAFESRAFQVTARGCAVGNLTYAHEHGHNMGFEHDPQNGVPPNQASYPWSFGHYVDGGYRTVMSYPSACSAGCPKVAHFSNPSVVHAGAPTGITDVRDNARTGDLTAWIVKDFREGPAPAVFGDGFESGNTAAWSWTVGGTSSAELAPVGSTAPAIAGGDLLAPLEPVELTSPGIADAWLVAVEAVQLERELPALRLVATDGTRYAARLSWVERRAKGDLAWIGHLDGDPDRRVVLTLKGGVVAGRIEAPGGTYEIRPAPWGAHLLLQLDSEAFPRCGVGPPGGRRR